MEKCYKLLQKFGLRPRPIVGISIQPSEIAILQITKVSSVYQVEAYNKSILPPDVIVDNEIKNPAVVTSIIKASLEEACVETQYAAIAIPSSLAITKVIELPIDYSEKDIIEEIEVDAQKYIPYDFEEVSFDYNLLGPSKNNSEMQSILLAATKRENVESYMQVVEDAGLTVDIVDIESLASNRTFNLVRSRLPDSKQQQKIATVSIGYHALHLSIYDNGDQVFSRDLDFGCDFLIKEIQERYGVEYTEAILVKNTDYLPEEYRHEVLEPFVDELTQNIDRMLQFFYSSEDEQILDYIILSGMGATLPMLLDKIYDTTQIKTILANPFSQMLMNSKVDSIHLSEDSPSIIVACGLALRSLV